MAGLFNGKSHAAASRVDAGAPPAKREDGLMDSPFDDPRLQKAHDDWNLARALLEQADGAATVIEGQLATMREDASLPRCLAVSRLGPSSRIGQKLKRTLPRPTSAAPRPLGSGEADARGKGGCVGRRGRGLHREREGANPVCQRALNRSLLAARKENDALLAFWRKCISRGAVMRDRGFEPGFPWLTDTAIENWARNNPIPFAPIVGGDDR